MKTESNVKQDHVSIEPIDVVMVRVILHANETKTENGYTYDRYTKEVINRPMLLQLIERDFDAWADALAKEENDANPKFTTEQRIADLETLVKGTPSYGELLEAVNILLGE